jgi:hypothetical protein
VDAAVNSGIGLSGLNNRGLGTAIDNRLTAKGPGECWRLQFNVLQSIDFRQAPQLQNREKIFRRVYRVSRAILGPDARALNRQRWVGASTPPGAAVLLRSPSGSTEKVCELASTAVDYDSEQTSRHLLCEGRGYGKHVTLLRVRRPFLIAAQARGCGGIG